MRDLAIDRLPPAGPSLDVLLIEDGTFGEESGRGPRAPHRHDYHELIWTREGEGHHLIDGEVSEVRAGTVTLIGRGQVHVFERARAISGAVVRFGDELVTGGLTWLAGGVRNVPIAAGDVPRLEGLVDALAAEARRPVDPWSIELQRHLLSALLLWVERAFESTHAGAGRPDDAEHRLHRRFSELLERDFARHPEAGHYADALAVPRAALSRALVTVTGRTTKELITDRRMLEAVRLLRFTDLTVGEVAHRAGYDDQLYFSRAFKRHHGVAPMAYREHVRG